MTVVNGRCHRSTALLLTAVFIVVLQSAATAVEQASTAPFRLNDRNQEAPFCYVAGSRRDWPVASGVVATGDHVTLLIRQQDETVVTGNPVVTGGLTISITDEGRLVVESKTADDVMALQVDIRHESNTESFQTQTLQLRCAPAVRPLTYLADFGDDIIRIFGAANNTWRPITQAGFDQYFRRLQAHGITRLIVWQSPFPYIADRRNYSAEDWGRYEGQANAILQNDELTAGIRERPGFAAYGWIRQLMALRLMPDFGEMLSRSANAHGIKLTASFRPFEAALTKYYVVPAFDETGRFLWNFQPLCSPTVNYHPDEIGFAHYREVLREMGHADAAELTTIILPGIGNAADLAERALQGQTDMEVVPAPFAPLAGESFVLVRQQDGQFQLQRWRDIQVKALALLQPLKNLQFESRDTGLVIRNISIPDDSGYLWIRQSADSSVEFTVSAETPAVMYAEAGNRLGGENLFFAWNETSDQPEPTRVHGIPPDGHYHAEFQATEASLARCLAGPPRVTLHDKQLVISLGKKYSVEMIDFNQPASRQFAVKQLHTLFDLSAFDDIIINTRSHTQLAGYLGDDGNSIRSLSTWRRAGTRDIWQVGLDKAYAPRAAAVDGLLRRLAADSTTVEQITTVQPGAWRALTCQTPDPYSWRYTRNRLIARGVRQLLLDLRREFPQTRIRAVIPPSEVTVRRVLAALDQLRDDHGTPFGRDYYRRLWCSNNHIPTFGEGMAMVDLTGTNIEPVLLGTGGYSQEHSTLKMYVRECLDDLVSNRGSSFRGPRSYFFEAQSSLRAQDKSAARKNREDVICHLLSQRDEINDVILYEAADWSYFLPLSDADLCGHGFLDRCNESTFGR